MNFKSFEKINENTNIQDVISEIATSTRYSVEVNYRTSPKEVLDSFAKICLGFVGAALKQNNFHIKHVYDEKPIRILVSSRNWDDGEWACVVSFNHEQECFVISKGFYNKDRRTVSIQHNKKCDGTSAADITREVRNLMHDLSNKPDRHQEKLKGVSLKRGPKK